MTTEQVNAYNRYRDAKSDVPFASKVAVDPRAIHPDFVEVMNRNYPRKLQKKLNADFGEVWNPIYDKFLSSVYTVLYEQGVKNVGPSIQVFQMSEILDITRNSPTSGYNWQGIDNGIFFDTWGLTTPTERIFLSNVTAEVHNENPNGPRFELVSSEWIGQKAVEHRMCFTQIAVPSGRVVWKLEYKIGGRDRMVLHLTELYL